MRYQIKHVTRYSYTEPVASCHNQVHLAPRSTPHQSCVDFRLWVHPTPIYRGQRDDYFGNRVDFFSIEEPHSGLTITSSTRIALSDPAWPAEHAVPSWEVVRDSLKTGDTELARRAYEFAFDSYHAPRQESFAEYARPSFPAQTSILTCVRDLTERIHSDFRYEARSTTISTPIAEVLERRVGVCQDFAHLQIACLRSLGLAARYVSGYLRTYPPPGKPRLVGADASHAWISVYCGPLGWVDFDPTNNKLTGTEHITVAFGRDYADVCPIQGVFVGGGQHGMTVSVDVQPLTTDAELKGKNP